MTEKASPDNAAQDYYAGDYVRFRPPSTWKSPSIEGDKPLSLVCDFKPDADGYLTMVTLGETPMPAEKAEDDRVKKGRTKDAKYESYKEDAADLVGALRSSGAMSSTLE